MFSKVLDTIKKYDMLKNGDSVVVGLSGGADSCALVHLLERLRKIYHLDITAVHINHGIRGAEADRDEKFAEDFCKRLGVKFVAYHCDIPKEAAKRSLGEEETGRIIRYEKFRETAEKLGSAKIAVAHNQNDSAETLMMHLCRGAGLKGLAGIRPVNGNIIRPVLYCSRKEIEQYCFEHQINFCTDSTNLETGYTRNKIRRILMPWLEKEMNSSAGFNIAKASELLREEEDYIESMAEKLYAETVQHSDGGKLILDAGILSNEHAVMRRRVLRIALRTFKSDLRDYGRVHIESADHILMGPTGKSIDLPGNVLVEKSYEEFIIRRDNGKKESAFESIIPVGEKVFVQEFGKYIYLSLKREEPASPEFLNVCTKTADYDKINGEIKLRTRFPGDTIGIKNGRKKLKNLLIDEKVPADKRNTMPVLACENRIILVGDRLGEDFYVSPETRTILYIYIWEELK